MGSTPQKPIGVLAEAFHSKRGAGFVPIESVSAAQTIDIVIRVRRGIITNRFAVCAAKLDVGGAFMVVVIRRRKDDYGCAASARAWRLPNGFRVLPCRRLP